MAASDQASGAPGTGLSRCLHVGAVVNFDNSQVVVIIVNMKAELLYRFREDFSDGAILEAVIWRVPRPIPGSQHPYKYRLFYGYPGLRLVGYDNERGKGDHRHQDERELPYLFTTPEKLIDDFLSDIDKLRSGP